MSLFTNKKFELLLQSYKELDEKKGVPHSDLSIHELFRSIRDSLNTEPDFDRHRIVPYPSTVNLIEEVSVMDLTSGFTQNPKSWSVIHEGEGCRGMFIWVDAPDESDYRYVDDEDDAGDIDNSYGNGHPVMLFWLSDDYRSVVSSDQDRNYVEYDVGDEEAEKAFEADFERTGMKLNHMYELLKMTMLYQVAFSCRIVKDNDDVYQQYKHS